MNALKQTLVKKQKRKADLDISVLDQELNVKGPSDLKFCSNATCGLFNLQHINRTNVTKPAVTLSPFKC